RPSRTHEQRRQRAASPREPAVEQRKARELPRRLEERAGEEHDHADGERLLVVVDDRVRHPRADTVRGGEAEKRAEPDGPSRAALANRDQERDERHPRERPEARRRKREAVEQRRERREGE